MPVPDRAWYGVGSIASKQPRLARVTQVGGKNFRSNPLPKFRVFQRKQNLNSLVEIARHPVRAAQINVWRTAVFEVEDAAVLQKTPNDAAHSNAAANSSQPRD